MNKETIEKAAEEYIHRDKTVGMTRRKAFIDGARWRIESIWNPINEVPGYGQHILVHFRSGNFASWFSSTDILLMFNKFEVIEWAYIADLMPDRKEEEK